MKIMKKIIYILLLILTFPIIGCWDEPLLTELGTNRLEIQLKGTYASNNPRAWFDVTNTVDMPIQEYNSKVLDDSVDDIPYSNDQNFPGTFKLDIAEIRLEDNAGHVDRFAMNRQTLEFPIKTGAGVFDENQAFFNGTGVVLNNDDPVPGRAYTKVRLYIRKMIFDEAKFFELKSTPEEGWKSSSDYAAESESNILNVIFAENDSHEGFDFNPYQTSYLWDAYREEQSATNRIFPLEIPIVGGLTFNNKKDKTVLEIRLVIKNFLKKYELDIMSSTPDYVNDLTSPLIVHYFALSDWLRDVRTGEYANGGNLHGVARSYVPGETGTITGTAPGTGYVIAVPSGSLITDYYADFNLSTSLRDRFITNNCNQPLIPSVPLRSINALMDFYVKYEKYRIDWKNFDEICGGVDGDMTNFEAAWNAYDGTSEDDTVADDGAARNFKVPPFATFGTLGQTITLSNMPAGTYNVYFIEHDIDTSTDYYGHLLESTYTRQQGDVGGEVTVTVTNGNVTTVAF